MYPRIEINLKKLKHNAITLINICKKKRISIALVTKVLAGNTRTIDEIANLGFTYIADSRLDNLREIGNIKTPKLLLRLPMISEIKRLVEIADISLNSELPTIKEINYQAERLNIKHKIILMFDLGDLREGIFYKDDYLKIVKEIIKLNNISLVGIGTNLSCYGGVIPTNEKLNELVKIKNSIEKTFNIKLDIISGGNSSSLYMLENNEMPKEINNLRIGEALFLGKETAFRKPFATLYDDIFTLKAELIEIKEKPSFPDGIIKTNAFGKKPIFEDKGLMNRGIIAIGNQDISPENLIPLDDYNIIGGSSDHLILELKKNHMIGDVLKFNINYQGLLQLMTSKYIRKVFL